MRQEQMSKLRDDPKHCEKSAFKRAGGLERDIGTPLESLSVYDPIANPGGIFICPTYIPNHTIRLVKWFEDSLPELGGGKMHFLHIDSEGEFFQLHTEKAGSLIIFTGMSGRVERNLLEQVRFKFKVDLTETFIELQKLTKAVCRKWTLNRLDVVFGGDRAACPIASQSKAVREYPKLPWMESDMTGWYWFIDGQVGHDFFCTRSIDKEREDWIVANCPMGFKNVVDCAVGSLIGPGDGCMCRKIFGSDWLKRCEIAHPQTWHGYPQSGAVSSKNLSREKLDWTILYYAVADLIKARMLTIHQPTVDIDIVTPIIEF